MHILQLWSANKIVTWSMWIPRRIICRYSLRYKFKICFGFVVISAYTFYEYPRFDMLTELSIFKKGLVKIKTEMHAANIILRVILTQSGKTSK